MNLSEGVQLVSFALLAAIVLGSALGVVLVESIVYSAFLLGFAFVGVAGLYLLLNADFVAAAQLLIYVGAVNVLILFGVMLVNKRQAFVRLPGAWVRRSATALVCLGLFALLAVATLSTPWAVTPDAVPTTAATVILGKHLFSDFLLPFELASVLLLMAMIGAIVLARRELLADDLPEADPTAPPELQLPERRKAPLAASSNPEAQS